MSRRRPSGTARCRICRDGEEPDYLYAAADVAELAGMRIGRLERPITGFSVSREEYSSPMTHVIGWPV